MRWRRNLPFLASRISSGLQLLLSIIRYSTEGQKNVLLLKSNVTKRVLFYYSKEFTLICLSNYSWERAGNVLEHLRKALAIWGEIHVATLRCVLCVVGKQKSVARSNN